MIPTFNPLRRSPAFLILLSIYILICLAMLPGCQANSKKENFISSDSVVISLPDPQPLSEHEAKNLGIACQVWYDSILEKSGFNGGIVVAKNGNIVFEKYKGMGHLDQHDTITANTSFHIASVSKTITAMAVLKLWQDKKLNIDDEFSKYFPAFNYPGVTIRCLLNHRSGLPNYTHFMEELVVDKKLYLHNQDVLDFLINRKADLKNIGTPNARFAYCNTNYALLALLIEKVTGKTYPEYIAKNYFRPLHMDHSFIFTHTDSARVIPSYDWRGRLIPINFLDLVYGDKNVYSTAEDMLKWDRLLRSGIVFKPETLEAAYTPYSNEKPGIRNYGLGWRMNIYPDGSKVIYHNGWWHGYNASFIRLINENATIIIMGNKFTKAIYKGKYLLSIFGNNYLPIEEEDGQSAKLPDSVMPK